MIPEGRIGHHIIYKLLLTPTYISSKRTRSDSMNPSLAYFSQNARRRSRKVDGFAAQCSRNQKCVFLPLHLDHCSYIDFYQICILAHVVRNSPNPSLLFNFPLNTLNRIMAKLLSPIHSLRQMASSRPSSQAKSDIWILALMSSSEVSRWSPLPSRFPFRCYGAQPLMLHRFRKII